MANLHNLAGSRPSGQPLSINREKIGFLGVSRFLRLSVGQPMPETAIPNDQLIP
jgi:hypothetical protein